MDFIGEPPGNQSAAGKPIACFNGGSLENGKCNCPNETHGLSCEITCTNGREKDVSKALTPGEHLCNCNKNNTAGQTCETDKDHKVNVSIDINKNNTEVSFTWKMGKGMCPEFMSTRFFLYIDEVGSSPSNVHRFDAICRSETSMTIRIKENMTECLATPVQSCQVRPLGLHPYRRYNSVFLYETQPQGLSTFGNVDTVERLGNWMFNSKEQASGISMNVQANGDNASLVLTWSLPLDHCNGAIVGAVYMQDSNGMFQRFNEYFIPSIDCRNQSPFRWEFHNMTTGTHKFRVATLTKVGITILTFPSGLVRLAWRHPICLLSTWAG